MVIAVSATTYSGTSMRFTFIPFFLALLWLSPGRADVIILNELDDRQVVHSSIEFLEDKAGTLNLEDVVNGPAKNSFTSPGEDYFSLGFTNSAYWYRFTINNITPNAMQRLLVLRTAWIDSVDIYLPSADGSYQNKLMGDWLPFQEREFNHHHFINSLVIPPGESVYLMRISTPKPFMTPLFLWEPQAFNRVEWSSAAYYGMIFGSILIMFLYNGIIYFSIRDRRYLYYCLYLVMFFIMNFTYNGFSYQYLWPDSTRWASWSYCLFVYLFQISGLLFAISFLNSRKRMPRLHRVLQAYIVLLLAAPLLTFLAGNELMFNKLAIYSIFMYSPLIAYAGLLALLTGFRAARFFIIASLASLVGAFFTALTVAGLLPYSFVSFHAVEFGLMIDMVLLSLAMADRINLMSIEKEAAQQRAIAKDKISRNLLQQAKENLEETVERRTAQLVQAKETAELMARIDKLTGVFNRRAFEEQAAAEYTRAKRHGHPLTVILLDIDNFKAINDTYGHKIGDSVLCNVAELAQKGIREIDYLGRIGGEEFAILLPETEVAQATEIAERIRHKMMTTSTNIEGHQIHYTSSFGVAPLESSHASLEKALRNADNAMYRSKREGRNLVTTWTGPTT